MDGNGRWAKKRGLPRRKGHAAGADAAKALVTECRSLGIEYVTLYTFSKENWDRPKGEIRAIFDLLVRFLKQELDTLVEQDIRLHILGETAELPLATRKAVKFVCAKTAKCVSMTLNLALNYSGRDEILLACEKLLQSGIKPRDLTEEMFKNQLHTAGQPDPDLIIRTSGELRLSNYLLFQAAYSELYFTDTLWPDFDKAELHKALSDFAGRKRRFGKTSEQTGP